MIHLAQSLWRITTALSMPSWLPVLILMFLLPRSLQVQPSPETVPFPAVAVRAASQPQSCPFQSLVLTPASLGAPPLWMCSVAWILWHHFQETNALPPHFPTSFQHWGLYDLIGCDRLKAMTTDVLYHIFKTCCRMLLWNLLPGYLGQTMGRGKKCIKENSVRGFRFLHLWTLLLLGCS